MTTLQQEARPFRTLGKPEAFCLLLLMVSLLPCPWSRAEEAVVVSKKHFRTGLAYERLGRLDDAYTQLQLAANLDPSNSSVAVALGTVAFRLGRFEEAQRAFEHSIAEDASSVAAYYQLGLLYEKKQMWDRAGESWHRFIELTHDAVLKQQARKHMTFLEGRR